MAIIGLLSSLGFLMSIASSYASERMLAPDRILHSNQRGGERLLHFSDSYLPCSELEVGESKVVRTLFPGVPAALSYLLKRSGAKSYEVFLKIRFVSASGKKARVSQDVVQSFYSRVDSCLMSLDRFLRFDDGKELKFRRLPVSDDPALEPRIIKLDSTPQFRSTGSRWSVSDMNCSTLFHELLHNLGLVDEYSETKSGWKKVDGKWKAVEEGAEVAQYSCRALGPNDSIMENPRHGFDNRVGEYFVRQCFCPSADAPDLARLREECLQAVAGYQDLRQSCPEPSLEAEYIYTQSQVEGASYFTQEIVSQLDRGPAIVPFDQTVSENMRIGIALISDFPDRIKPILKPAHVRAILYPGCKKRNPVYYACAKNAYRSEFKRYPWSRGCIPRETLPKSCYDGSYGWLN